MTRAMFVTVLWNLENRPALTRTASFTDVPSDTWYENPVLWAAESDIVSGIGDGNYGPAREITRQEMVTMMGNYAKFKGYTIPVNREMPDFTDYGQVASWADEPARALSESGVISGDNNAFMPVKTATRAEVAQMFKNFMRFVVKK